MVSFPADALLADIVEACMLGAPKAQALIKKAVAASYDSHSRPHEAGLVAVFDRVADRIGELDTIAPRGAAAGTRYTEQGMAVVDG